MNEANRESDLPVPQDKAAEPTSPAPAEMSAPVDIQSYIGQQLRAVYENVARQPVPDRFLDLMRQLDAK